MLATMVILVVKGQNDRRVQGQCEDPHHLVMTLKILH